MEAIGLRICFQENLRMHFLIRGRIIGRYRCAQANYLIGPVDTFDSDSRNLAA
jgi:hypothetical protein